MSSGFLTVEYQPVSDELLRSLFANARTIAVVGHSPRPERTSYQIAQFLRQAGYRVIPVNPAVAAIDGERCYASLAAVPEIIDIVNVFRRSEYLPGVVNEAIAGQAGAIWAQLGIHHSTAAAAAAAAGISLIMDTCIKVEYLRLGMEPGSHV